jgi:Holliday junction resolvasome RuvABC endonuclease subunit
MNNFLALDLGTKTGFAFNSGDRFYAGTWKLSSAKELRAAVDERLNRRCDVRIPEFFRRVFITLHEFSINVIVFEDVQFSKYTLQTQLWSSLRGALWTVPAVYFDCVPVTTLKKFATGNGGADKEAMKRAFDRLDFTPFKRPENDLDDNGIDATFIWLWAMKNLNRIRL